MQQPGMEVRRGHLLVTTSKRPLVRGLEMQGRHLLVIALFGGFFTSQDTR